MTQSTPPLSFFEIWDIVKSEFETKEAYVEEGIPAFILAQTPKLRESVESLRAKLKPHGLEIIIGKSGADIKLLVLARPPTPKRTFSSNYPLILFIVTVITVAISGYLTTQGYLEILRTVGKIGRNEEFSFLWGQTALYTLSVMSIIGLHELGHTIACRLNHVDASFPMFIPGIPGVTLGTFGAVIMQKEPALNRNQLFDIGFAGPFVGFVVALIVSSFGYSFSLPVTRAEFELISTRLGPSGFVSLPLVFTFLEPYLMPNPGSFTHFLHPLAFAGWMGTLITFLNAFPIGQFDGGHVARAVLGPRGHRVASYVGTIAMFLTGWWSMAILAFFMRFNHPGTLDDVSPLSPNRRALALLFVVLFVACFTISPDSLLALFM